MKKKLASLVILSTLSIISGLVFAETYRIEGPPLSDGEVVTLKSLGTAEGPRYLSGNTRTGQVMLLQNPGAHTGASWQVKVRSNGVQFYCLGSVDGPRWLALDDRSGRVFLTENPNPQQTLFIPQQSRENMYLSLVFQSQFYIPYVYISGNTRTGEVMGLQPSRSNASGARWTAARRYN